MIPTPDLMILLLGWTAAADEYPWLERVPASVVVLLVLR